MAKGSKQGAAKIPAIPKNKPRFVFKGQAVPLEGNVHVFHFSQETEDTQKQRLTNQEPQFMTLTLRLDPVAANIGTKLPKDDRHVAHGPLEMFEDSFQISLPESSELSDENHEEDRAADSAEDHAKEPSPAPETVREDASERLPSPTPGSTQAEPSVPSSTTTDSTTTLGQWQSDGHAELMFLNSVQYSYPTFPAQYPSNLAFSDPFVFENCSVGFSGAHSLLGSSGLTCSFPFPDSRHDLGPDSTMNEDRQHFVDNTLGIMGATPFNLDNTGGVPNAYGRTETLQDSRSSSTQQDDVRNTFPSSHNTEQGHNPTQASDTNVEVPHRLCPDQHDVQETTETRPGNRRKPRKARKQKQPPIKPVQIPSIPSLPTLPSLPSIFPPEWHGSNVMEGRVPMEHTGNRRFAPLLPAVPPREPTPPPPSLVGHPNSSIPHYLPTSYPPLLLDRPYPQTTLPPMGCAPGMATLRPAIWPMPPPMLLQADSRHGLTPGQLTPMFAQGPGEVCLPGIGQFSYMSGLPSASLQAQSSGSHHWTTHFDFLQDELHERMRLQKIQDKFNRKNNICGKASTKRRMLTHPCPLCDRSFMRRNSLAIHMKWHYKPREEMDTTGEGETAASTEDGGAHHEKLIDEAEATATTALHQTAPGPIAATDHAARRENVLNISSLLSSTQHGVASPITPLATPPGTPLIRSYGRSFGRWEHSDNYRMRTETASSDRIAMCSLFGSPIQERSP